MTLNRRSFLAAISVQNLAYGAPNRLETGGLKLGVATYSLRKFSRQQAIEILRKLGVHYLSVKEFHLPYKDSAAALALGRQEFDAAGLEVLSGGVIVTTAEAGSLRKYFEYGKTCRMPMLIIMPTARQLPEIDALAKEYGVRVAVHNHGPEDKNFATPQSVYEAIRPLDKRIGLCIDVGHTTRAGANVVESIQRYSDRLMDIHIKDLKDAKSHSDCEVGTGVLPIPEVLKTLHKLRYAGNIALEYEADPDDPLPGMRASMAYMHGVVDGFTS